MSEFNQEESVVGRVITGCAPHLLDRGMTGEELEAALHSIASAAKMAWRTLYPPSDDDRFEEMWKPEEEAKAPESEEEKPRRAPSTLPWGEDVHPRIDPASMSSFDRWKDKVPFHSKKDCPDLGYPWRKVTYEDLLENMTVQVEGGKPKYGTAWGTLAWVLGEANPKDEKYGKSEEFKIANIKGLMLEVERRRPAEGTLAAEDKYLEEEPTPF